MKLYTPSLLQRTDSKATLPLKADLKEYDERHPTYLGNWSRSIPPSLHFAQDSLDEPHVKRKLTILAQYPKVTELYGREPLTALITLGGVLIQLYFANYFGKQQQPSIPLFLATAYIIGGTITHVFGVVIHEACHNLIFKSPFANRLVGFLANVGIPFPIAASFKRYHLEHHAFQGVTDKDPDLPLPWEIRFCNGSPVFKFLFLLFYPLMYVIRGAVQQKSPSFWEIVNLFYTIGTDILVYTYCGGWGLGYLGMSLWLGYSIHPGAAHFLQEHFTFLDGQETYSYYGSGNLWAMNIGYHNEHHDFTKIPWTNLPRLRSLASEFYDNCAYHSSWIKVLIDFVFDPTIGPQSRVERAWEAHNAGRRMIGKVNGKEVKEGEDVDEKEEDEKKVKAC